MSIINLKMMSVYKILNIKEPFELKIKIQI